MRIKSVISDRLCKQALYSCTTTNQKVRVEVFCSCVYFAIMQLVKLLTIVRRGLSNGGNMLFLFYMPLAVPLLKVGLLISYHMWCSNV